MSWNARGRGQREGLLLGPLRAPPARGPPLPDEEVLDAPREGRAERHLRTGRASHPTRGHERGDISGPRPRLPRKGRRLDAARVALSEGIAANLAGGTHHAFADRGEGFCALNDSAIAARVLLAEGLVEKVVVLDTDVHQGNGTAAILFEDHRVFTLS